VIVANGLRWGILGTGNIARQFTAGLKTSQRGNRAVAVGSRAIETAKHFAQTHELDRFYGTYDALLADREVDAIYVSLPNTLHHEWTIRALRAGKHVLCEKPFAMSVAEAQEMFDAAKRAGKLVVEAFMYHSHPVTDAIKRAIADGAIGRLQLIRASFCYRTIRTDVNVRFKPELGGGGLLDTGCYCVNFARTFAQAEPTRISVFGRMHHTGVDDLVVANLEFPGGIFALFSIGTQVQANNVAQLCGSEGYIEIPVPWKPPQLRAEYSIAYSAPPRMDNLTTSAPTTAPPRKTFHVDAPATLYALEADDFAATVLDGRPPRITEADTIGNTRVLDEMRRQLQQVK
jgi:predicted dehydrogenase